MLDYEVEAPADCTATQRDERDARVLAHFAEARCVPSLRSADVAFESRSACRSLSQCGRGPR